ncbi:uncharacterized protein C8A04DRAFT_15588 [Dichotomopilus funicola]|uniref:DNA-directed DNA polymerase n=1 Tax=Dichotomopilus funicola TaxID=1934379 RepID=A0AAN6UVW6_9PEZI|nr:hypothetical protein C8A04DRAFT_15588 [Dichotomopilus funicola]
MSSPSLSEKTAFFDQLDALDNIRDEDDVIDEKERKHREMCRAFFNSRKKPERIQETPAAAPQKATSIPGTIPGTVPDTIPVPASTTPGPQIIKATPITGKAAANQPPGKRRSVADPTSFVEETPIPDTARPLPSTLRSTTFPLPDSSSVHDQSPSASTALRKRKRQASTKKTVPEAAQVLRGLSFYYIPNNDIAPARRLRIGRAQEYGAQWVQALGDATHAIVDKQLTYQDIRGVLGTEVADSLIIVNEEYPIDCISFRMILNPHQLRYRVLGSASIRGNSSSERPATAASEESNHSLQVKTSRSSKRRGSRSTPPRPEDPSPVKNTRGSLSRPTTGTTLEDGRSEIQVPHSDLVERPNIDQEAPRPPPFRRKSSSNDELAEYIELLQQYKDLPLDAEDEDAQSARDPQDSTGSSSDIEEGSEDERARKRTATMTKPRRSNQKEISFADRFSCNRGGTKEKSANAANPNAKTIEILQRMCDYYNRINDTWRAMAYRKGIATLRRQTTKITTEDEAYRLPNIGRRLAAKIEEIVSTNRLRRLEYAHDEPVDQILELFLGIYGVGTSRASKWIAQGHRTLDDLRRKADLTPHQRLGIDHYADLNTRIPRAEVAALFEYVCREAAQLDDSVDLLVGGSYRRGAESSGDIDIIVTRKGTTSSGELVPFLEELVDVLTRKGFLVATLAALHAQRRPGKDGPGGKWHGCCQQNPNPWRRIDFLLVPESEYGAALIYFTGNDIFNRSMRLLASKRGMRLNQKGLYKDVMQGRNREKITEGELLEGRDERRIFEVLGVKWREPWERWC